MRSAADMLSSAVVSSAVQRRRAVLRGMIKGEETAWGTPPPRLSWRTIFLVAFLQAVASVAFLRSVMPDPPRSAERAP